MKNIQNSGQESKPVPFLDLGRSHKKIQREVIQRVKKTLRRGDFILGSAVEAFESEYAEFLGNGTLVVGVGNGTDALEIAIRALDLPPGSEVLVPANSFIASAIGVERAGLTVKFVDPHPDTLLVNADSFRDKITQNTSALMVVHLYGHVAPMTEILDLGREFNLKVIEDAAQSQGATYKGTRVGCLGDVGATSFYPGKNLGAFGDGGAVLSRSPEIAQKARLIRNLGSAVKYQHETYGFNSRLDTIQAEILRIKLKHLAKWNAERARAVALYDKLLSVQPEMTRPVVLEDTEPAYHLYPVLTNERDRLQKHLTNHNVQTLIHYPNAIPDQPIFRELGEGDGDGFVAARKASAQLLSLPLFPGITESEVRFVCEKVDGFFNKKMNI